MATVLQPWQVLVAAMAGWITRQQDAVIEDVLAAADFFAVEVYAERFVRSIKDELMMSVRTPMRGRSLGYGPSQAPLVATTL